MRPRSDSTSPNSGTSNNCIPLFFAPALWAAPFGLNRLINEFVVPPLGGSVWRHGMGLYPRLPPKGGTTNCGSIAKAKGREIRGERRLSWLARMRLLPFFKNFFDFGAGPWIDVARAVFAATHHLAFELFGVNRILGGFDHIVDELRREKQHPLFVTDDDVTRQDRHLADANGSVPFDSDLVGHRRSVSAGVIGREIFHRKKLVQITNAAVNDHAAYAGQFHGQPGHIAHKRRAIDRASEFDHSDVSGPPIFARPDVVLVIPIALVCQLAHTLIEVGANGQITHRQRAPYHLHTGLR